MHCKNLYEASIAVKMMCYGSLSHVSLLYIEDICIGLKKLASRKASDLRCLKAEMLKWAGKEAHVWITDMCNDALQHGMPYD